jgi:cytochrome c biogenesis protein CcdA
MSDTATGAAQASEQGEAAVVGQAAKQTEDYLWKWFIAGLVVIAVMAVAGVVVTVAIGRPTDTILTIFTSTLAALMGLFVKSPIQSKQEL